MRKYSKEDIEFITNAVRYVLVEYANTEKERNEVGKAVGADSTTIGKYNRGIQDYRNMKSELYMKVFEFYINKFQNSENIQLT